MGEPSAAAKGLENDAQHAMGDLTRGVEAWFASGYDLLLTPTLGEPPCLLGEFGQLIPFAIRPRNVELPFRWFFRELGLS